MMTIGIKKIFLAIILSLFLFSFVSAADTKTQTTFIIGGCSTSYEGQQITSPKGTCYRNPESTADGKYYCTADGYFMETMIPSDGCSLNRDTLPDPLNLVCCPEGYYCTDDSGAFECVQRTDLCSSYEVKSTCEDWQCTWLEELDQCIGANGLYDLSCDFYDNQPDCEADNLSLAIIGVGSDIIGSSVECGGSIYSVSQEDSSCVWDGENCSLNYVVQDSSIGGTGGSFECSNVYTLGECIEGEQSVTWASESNLLTGGSIPDECLTALGCKGGSEDRYCGEETIKLPGFSLFSFIASISIIGIWYFAKSTRFK